MVRATTSVSTERHDLKSIEGGWVEIRPMTYGQFLKRRDMAMKMGVTGLGGGKSPDKLDIDLIQEAVTMYEFEVCIADHNLEDETGRKLSLSNPGDFGRLDPKIGQEISDLIEELTQWERPKSPDGNPSGDRTSDTVSEASQTEERDTGSN